MDARFGAARSGRLACLLLLCALAVVLRPALVSAADKVIWERYDVTLELRDDGTYHVAERQQIEFDGGPYHGGFATIPLDRIDSITNVTLSEETDEGVEPYRFVDWSDFDEDPETFTYRDSDSEIEINWGFQSTTNRTRTFLLEYDVAGALRIYGTAPDVTQQIWWTAVSKDVTDVAPVEEATMTIVLPRPIDPATALLGVDAEEAPADHTSDGQTWTWSESNMNESDEFIVRLEFPALVNATIPNWQEADDTRRLNEEKSDDRQALYDLTFIGVGLALLVLGGVGLFGLWYGRGRDPHVGLVAEFLPAPPDDLPPGAAGVLLDEVAHERDIVATVVDLGRRGMLKIDEQPRDSSVNPFGAGDFSVTLANASAEVTPFERTIVTSLFPSDATDGATVKLSSARAGFGQYAGAIKEQMYAELVQRGYFASSPESTRQRWRRGSIAASIVIAILACVVGGFLSRVSAFAFFPIIVAGAVALLLIWMSDILPKKTLNGAEAAAKWNAFKRYLGNIEKYDKLGESQQIFDKFLPYAVAFGLEESWVRKFSAAGAAPPPWYGPVIISGPGDWSRRPRMGHGGGVWVFPSGGGGVGQAPSSGGGHDFDMPDLQDVSDSAGRKLSGTSNSFFDLLNSAAEAFSDMSSSGGGGGRRHWGGGGGGFHGGGGHGGSSGGGKRGFH